MAANGHMQPFGGDGNVLKLDGGDGCATLNLLNCILKMNEFYGIKLHLSKVIKKKKQKHFTQNSDYLILMHI